MASPRRIRVAAVQLESKNGAVRENLAHALPFVEQAAARGAELIVLPELMPTGYVYSQAIWDGGEPSEGPTVGWLKQHAKRLRVHLGTSFLEAQGEDFFNTFVLATPDGTEAGRVRKATPAAYEAYFTKGDPGPHVIATQLGLIGVGICYENILSYMPRLLEAHSVDLVLMPHSAPSPARNLFTPQDAIDAFLASLKGLSVRYAQQLGVPTIMVNKCGRWETPLPWTPFLKQLSSSFPGLSSISDSDGRLLAQLGAEEGILVEDVILDPTRKTHSAPACKGRWTQDFPWGIRIWRQAEAVGSLWYRFSPERRRRARASSRAFSLGG